MGLAAAAKPYVRRVALLGRGAQERLVAQEVLRQSEGQFKAHALAHHVFVRLALAPVFGAEQAPVFLVVAALFASLQFEHVVFNFHQAPHVLERDAATATIFIACPIKATHNLVSTVERATVDQF